MPFVHLHTHSEYSMLDGASKPKELVARAAQIGQTALALTDHDGLYGAVDLCEATTDGKVKPILGAELRCVQDYSEQTRGWHVTALALNEQGYHNLCSLITSGFRPKHFYHKPRVTIEELAENHDGIALLSGCWLGYPSQLYEEMASTGRDRTGVFSEITEQLRAAYGERLLFELYTGDFGRSKEIIPWLIEASKTWGIKTVATNDAHFASPDDWRKAELLRRIRRRSATEDADTATMPRHQYLATEEEMLGWLPADAVANTVMVADWANFSLDLAIDDTGNVVLPKVLERLPAPPIPEGKSDWGVFVEALNRGWQTRMAHVAGQPDHVIQQYHDRLRREMKAFKDTNLAGYMLIVADMAQFCAENGILKGPGRGSASGSLCSYLLGITDIDPIAAGLFFERFLDVERASMPDIDLDFDWEERERVFGYLQRTYGTDRVARICTFQTLEWKAAIKDVGAAMGLDFEDLNSLNSLIRDWDALDLSLPPDQAGDNADALRMIGQNPDLVTVVEQARMICGSREGGKRVKGAIRQVGAHAAGIVIANEPITHLSPQQPTRRDSAVEIYQFDMDQTESMGLLKIDVLNLRTLGAARDAIAMVKARRGVDVDWYSIPVDDPGALAMARAGRTVAIFQLEKRTAQEALRQIGPTSLQDMAVVEALNRPGPLEFIPEYAHRKHHPQDATCDLLEWEEALRDTYGIMVYQEQVIQCLWALGFTFTEADEVRRAIGKKKKEQIIEPLNRMKREIVARGYPQALADNLAEKLVKFADYAFNKAHATAYACISMRMLWLKINYPEEFMAAALTSQDDDKFFRPYIEEVPRLGLTLLPPDINLAGEQFQPEDGAVRFGLSRIKHVGQKLSRAIVAVRQIKPRGFRGESAPDGSYPYTDPIDFCRRLKPHGLDRRQLECLIWAGAFDAFSPSRQYLAERVEEIMEIASKGHASMEALLRWDEFIQPAHAVEDDVDEVQLQEYELMSCSPGAMARDVELRARLGEGTMPLAELEPGQQGVTVCGRVLEMGVRPSKKGRNYMYLQFTDGTSVQRGLCFDDELIAKLEEIGSQVGIVVKGNVSDDGDAFFIRQIVRVDAQP